MTPAERAERYVADILADRIVHNKDICQAVNRHVRDLECSNVGSRWVYDHARANSMPSFGELLPHTKGVWGNSGKPIYWEDWQCFYFCSIFGWLNSDTLNRRFRRSYLKVARKNGKSLMMAPFGLFMLAFDGEYGAEVYCGATTERQAFEVFKPARIICQKTPQLVAAKGIDVRVKNINVLADGAKFEPVIGNPPDGASPHAGIADEYHEHKTDAVIETLETGMGARLQPHMAITTTAGDDLDGPCYDFEVHCKSILSGEIDDDETFALIYGIDEGDDWKDPKILAKANPNMGVSVQEDFLLSQQATAIQRANKRASFRTKHLNEWVNAFNAYFDIEGLKRGVSDELWLRGSGANVEICPALKGQRCYVAFDLASKLDLSAMALLFEYKDGFALLAKAYVPESAIDGSGGDGEHQRVTKKSKNFKYAQWADEGLLTVTPGARTDFKFILEDFAHIARLIDLEDVAFDPFQANQFATELVEQGFDPVEYGQTVKNMSEPLKELESVIADGRLYTDGSPVVEWCFANVVAALDQKENVYPRKPDKNSAKRIDIAVAAIMTMGRHIAIKGEGDKPRPFEKGLRFV